MTAPAMTSARHEWIRPYPLGEKIALAGEIVAMFVRVRLLLWTSDLPSVLAELRAGADGQPAYDDRLAEKAAAIRLGRAIGRIMRFVPGDSRCLTRSLVLAGLLARRGVKTTLVIGVVPGPDFRAHAWVESEKLALLPPLDDVYERLVEV
ncbi:MAG TPA: lasso peptide biosynthesis B2 protein [Gaiellaceae bacterium]